MADTKEEAHTKASSLSKLSGVCRGTMPSLPPPPGGLGWYRRSLASPHHPPLSVVGGRGAPEALPSLLPPLPPTRGGLLQFVVTALHVRKKKVCRMSHTEKKMRNREKKTCEWAWRMGLLKLRRSRGSPSHSASLWERSRARPARPPAPWTSEQGTRGGC